MTDDDFVKAVLKFFYPDKTVSSVTDKHRALAATMLANALWKSDAMDYVPRPSGTRPGAKWLLQIAIKSFWRSRGDQKIYEAVRVTVALRHRSQFVLAAY